MKTLWRSLFCVGVAMYGVALVVSVFAPSLAITNMMVSGLGLSFFSYINAERYERS